MSIQIKQVIIHNLNINNGTANLSDGIIHADDRLESFIIKQFKMLRNSPSISEALYKEEQIALYPEDHPRTIFKDWHSTHFYRLSEILANTLYKYMVEYGNIPNGDLILAELEVDSIDYVFMFKVNFNNMLTHIQHAGKMNIIENQNIYNKSVSEAFIADLTHKTFYIVDTSKSKYLGLMMDVSPKLSLKESIAALEKVATTFIEETYDNTLPAIHELKANISEVIARTGTIHINEVINDTFDEESAELIKKKLEHVGIDLENAIPVTQQNVVNKFNNTRLRTDTGVEIKLPVHLTKDTDFFRVIDAPNGTKTLMISNVSQIISK